MMKKTYIAPSVIEAECTLMGQLLTGSQVVGYGSDNAGVADESDALSRRRRRKWDDEEDDDFDDEQNVW